MIRRAQRVAIDRRILTLVVASSLVSSFFLISILFAFLWLQTDADVFRLQMAELFLPLLFTVLGCAAFVTLAARRPARLISRPIRDLHQVAKAVSQTGEYSLRARCDSHDELGQLTADFNGMLEEIETRQIDLVRTRDELEAWVEELKRSQGRERELLERLGRSEKMESLGCLAGGVAHDLNNILGPVVGFPDLILESMAEDDPNLGHLEMIRDSAVRAAEIVLDLLTLARRGSYPVEAVNLSDVVSDYLGSYEFEMRQEDMAHIDLEVKLGVREAEVEGSAPHLNQVVVNLISNAVEAMPGGGTLDVKVYETSLESEKTGFEKIPAGSYSVLSVSDQGRGIDTSDLGRIFEPFFSKKHLGHSGSGLGLAVVWGVIKDLGGFLDVQTAPGQGTTFKAYLPLLILDSRQLSGPTDLAELAGEETILVVDDEPIQRDLADALLTSLGYRVVSCNSGRAAIEYLANSDVDLVILDMIMEEDFDGLSTFRHVVEQNPAQRCLIASGFCDSSRVKEALRTGVLGYVSKPYTREEIGDAVREALAACFEEPRSGRILAGSF